MNEIDALQNQFHDELHTTNLKIIDVSNNINTLFNRFSTVEESNREVNTNLNALALRIDNLVSSIKKLDTKTAEAVENVQVRAMKSAARSVGVSELTNLHEEIHEVALAVDNLSGDLTPRVEQLEIYVDDLYDKATSLFAADSSIRADMEEMDIEHHEELHRLALAIDNLDSSVYTLWNDTSIFKVYSYQQFEDLHTQDSSLEAAMIDMDIEHHEELHLLAMKIDELNDKIATIYNYYIDYEDTINRIDASIYDLSTNLTIVTDRVNSLPPLIVLTKEEYDDLDNPDYNSFYFTYEDEE